MSEPPWGSIELEEEVRRWLETLSDREFGHVAFHLDLLECQGIHLGEPYSRCLEGKLRELRFHLNGESLRITYFIASDRRIVLLTVFTKHGRTSVKQVRRAKRAMRQCQADDHLDNGA